MIIKSNKKIRNLEFSNIRKNSVCISGLNSLQQENLQLYEEWTLLSPILKCEFNAKVFAKILENQKVFYTSKNSDWNWKIANKAQINQWLKYGISFDVLVKLEI